MVPRLDIAACRKDMEQIARAAGRHVMRFYGSVADAGKDISGKSAIAAYRETTHQQEKSAFSEVDETTQVLIMEALAEKYRECGIHYEESNPAIERLATRFAYTHTLPDDAYTFIVDPIDGTRNFLNSNPANHGRGGDPGKCDYFAVSIHLAHGKKIVAGVFYFPALEVLLSTAAGQGTAINGKLVQLPQNRAPQFTDPVRVGKTVPELAPLFSRNIGYGSSCGNLLALLTGDLTVYFVKEVDLLDFGCSGLAYREAGGFVGDIHSQPVDESDLVVETKDALGLPVILVRGFMGLTPTREYHQRLMRMIAEKGVDPERLAAIG